jgi:hypothetical protein
MWNPIADWNTNDDENGNTRETAYGRPAPHIRIHAVVIASIWYLSATEVVLIHQDLRYDTFASRRIEPC